MFTDVEGSTPLRERLGEERFNAALAEYEALLSAAAREHGGTQEMSAGDGHLLAFRGARGALRCAVGVQRAAAAQAPDFKVRMGVHTGELERLDGRLRGRALVKGARIGAMARGGEVLASAVVREVADLDEADGDIWFEPGAEVELRGLRGRHALVTVRWERRRAARPRVVIADDAAIVRDGVAALLREHGVQVVATASDADGLVEAVARPARRRVVDIRMPPTHTDEGLVAAEQIRSRAPGDRRARALPARRARARSSGSSAAAERGPATCSRTASPTSTCSSTRCAASRAAGVSSTRASQPGRRARRRGGSLRELTDASARCSACSREGPTNRAIAERLVARPRRSRRTSARSSPSSACARRAANTAG